MLAAIRLTLIGAAVIAALIVVPARADVFPTGPVVGGGAYVVQTCGESGSTAGWAANVSNSTALQAQLQCPPVKGTSIIDPNSYYDTGIWVADHLANAGGTSDTPQNGHAETTFSAMPGTTITRVRMWRIAHKDYDDNWQPYLALGDGTIVDTCTIGSAASCDVGSAGWRPNDQYGTLGTSYRDLSGISTPAFIVGLRCLPNVDLICGNGYSIHEANAELYSAFFTIADGTPPTLGTPSGAGWTATGWQHGTLPLSMSSSDTTGIAETRVYADGSLLTTLQRSCAYDRPRPCTDEPTGAVGLPTADLPDGLHSIELAAVDAAGNETRVGRAQQIAVDNQAPAAPVGISSPALTSTTNSFSAAWSLPADSGTPITAARYQVCGSSCGPAHDAASLTSTGDVQLPTEGTYMLRVWLVDQLGHEAPASGATRFLTYSPPAPQVQPDPIPTPGPLPTPTPLPDPQPAPTPTPAPTKASASLRIIDAHRTGRRLAVAGRIARTATGRVTVRVAIRLHGRLHTLTARTAIAGGRFRRTVTIPRNLARAKTLSILVRYAGDEHTSPASRTAVLRLAK